MWLDQGGMQHGMSRSICYLAEGHLCYAKLSCSLDVHEDDSLDGRHVTQQKLILHVLKAVKPHVGTSVTSTLKLSGITATAANINVLEYS